MCVEHRSTIGMQLYLHGQSTSKLQPTLTDSTSNHTISQNTQWQKHCLEAAHSTFQGSAPSFPPFPRRECKAHSKAGALWPPPGPGCCDRCCHHPVLPRPSSLPPPACSCLFHDAGSVLEQEWCVYVTE